MTRLLVVFLLALSPTPAFARDVYVLQGFSQGSPINDQSPLWTTDAIFFNSSAGDRTVSVIGLSNGVTAVPASFTVAARKTVRLQQAISIPAVPLVMIHLDAPDDVIIENALYIGIQYPFGVSPGAVYRKFGKVRLPVFTAFVPPNQSQVQLETDIGDIPAHINVGIYNAGAQTATAHIETHEHCDDGAISTMDVSVPPNAVIQVGPFQAETIFCYGFEQDRSVYTVVKVDQPSLTFVSALANPATFPTTSISVAGN